jgi:ABC-type oligopeptide transport system substrate-binding subunit
MLYDITRNEYIPQLWKACLPKTKTVQLILIKDRSFSFNPYRRACTKALLDSVAEQQSEETTFYNFEEMNNKATRKTRFLSTVFFCFNYRGI